ncbi:MesJ tRNA(Ile)-lysidine synthase MesJ [Candidatus Nanopelagicaceae bacterium]
MVDATVLLRNAVKPFLAELEAGDAFLVAISGGADSLALAAALLIEAKGLALNPIAVTIDHQLQENSDLQAMKVSEQLKELGYGQVIIQKVLVDLVSGIEAGARDARYAALVEIAQETKAVKIFLGHTRDDQAETVLLGLARGSGARSLSAMAHENGIYIRPLLSITRAETEAACKEWKLDFWNDPHNLNTEFTRVKVRREVIPYLEEHLDPGISRALVRTAALLRDDADALDQWANRESGDLDCDRLAALPKAIRTRIIRRAALEAGATPGQLTFEQVGAIDALICAWKGQGAVSLAGGVKVERISGRLSLSR